MVSVEQQAVKTAIGIIFRVDGKVMLRREDDAFLLVSGDARRRPAKTGVAPQANFNKYERLSIAADQVDFAATAAEVARQHLQTVALKKACGEVFGAVANRFACFGRGIVTVH